MKRFTCWLFIILLLLSLIPVGNPVTITTSSPSDVEETTATLIGTLSGNDGVTCGFWYNTSTTSQGDPGYNVTCTGTYDNGETFTKDITGLTSGEYYYYRSWGYSNGSFTLLDDIATSGSNYKIWSDGNYIYTTNSLLGLCAYSFDGSDFTLLDTDATGGANHFGVWGDSNYIYCGCTYDGIRAYSFDGNTLTHINSMDDGGAYSDVWADDSYIYVTIAEGGIRAYSFDGADFTSEGYYATGYYDGVWSDGTYIYTTSSSSDVRIFSFDGATFTVEKTQSIGGTAWEVSGNSSYIFLGGNGLYVYTFNGVNLTLIDSVPGDSLRAAFTDDTYIYAVRGNSGIRAYQLIGGSLTEISNKDDGGYYIAIWCDSNYIYVLSESTPMYAYSFGSVPFSYSASEQYFLTKPYKPCNLTINSYQNQLNISWDNATTGDVTQTNVLRYKTTGYPTSVTDGTLLYNGSTNYTILPNYTPGTTYYFKVWTYIQTSGSPLLYQYSDSGDGNSTTAPSKPTNLIVTDYNESHITLGWTKGTGDTVILRNTTGYPDSPTNGTEVYNGSLQTYNDVGLIPSTTYYYRAWNWNGTGYSVGFVNVSETTLPRYPLNVTSETTIIGDSSMDIKIDWDTGHGATHTLIRRSYVSQPLLPTSGTGIYNNTGTTHTDSGITQPAFYTVFSYNSTTGLYSSGINVTWYVVWINCYNETSGIPITGYTVFFTNPSGSETYSKLNCNNPQLVNVSDVPTGDDIQLTVNADGYQQREYNIDIDVTSIFYIDAFLVPEGVSGGEGNSSESYLYLLQVINQYTQPVKGAKITIKKYINETFEYADVSIIYTDASGYASVFLMPETPYKFIISKSGYENETSNWIPNTDVLIHVFQLNYVVPSLPVVITGYDIFNFTAYFLDNDNNTLYMVFNDITGNNTNAAVKVYQNGTLLVYQYNITTGSASFTFASANHTKHNYTVRLEVYNHPDLDASVFTTEKILQQRVSSDEEMFNKAESIEDNFVAVIGQNIFGWVAMIVLFLSIYIMSSLGKSWIGIGIAGVGGVLFLFQAVFGLPNFTVIQLAVIPFFILYGFLVQIAKGKKEVNM